VEIRRLWFGGVFIEDRPKVTKGLLGQSGVEQVGYLSDDLGSPAFTMMGNELSVNGLLAAAKDLRLPDGNILGVGGLVVGFRNTPGETSITVPLKYEIEKRENEVVVVFGAMGYIVSPAEPRMNNLKKCMREQCEVRKLPAFGYVWSYLNLIRPYVYVKETDSLVAETACGSGSVAAYIAASMGGLQAPADVVQPSGNTITVWLRDRAEQIFTISAAVSEKGGTKSYSATQFTPEYLFYCE
jgi:hypothetical protein